jgi:hypothetical protein
VFRVNAYGVRGNSRKASRLCVRSERQHAQHGNAISYGLRPSGRGRTECFGNDVCRRRFDWQCAIRRPHLAPRDAASIRYNFKPTLAVETARCPTPRRWVVKMPPAEPRVNLQKAAQVS